MPSIVIHSLELTDEQKEVIAEKFITTLSELTKVPKDRIYLVILWITLLATGFFFQKGRLSLRWVSSVKIEIKVASRE